MTISLRLAIAEGFADRRRVASPGAISLNCLSMKGGIHPPSCGEMGGQSVNGYGGAGKLVRNRVPQMIRDGGGRPVIYTAASPDEYRARLRDKLRDKFAGFLVAEKDSGEKLSDLREVVYALADDLGVDANQVEEIRAAKAAARGGFGDRTVWLGNR
ncbi:nucleoside triphosphate pyrophosphohydrolase [Streptomyces olivaceoviridis]